jgi:ribose-phosphate pyrophosphokinase
VTNSFPIDPIRSRTSKKLVVIDLSNLLSEAIRRNHHGGMDLTVLI